VVNKVEDNYIINLSQPLDLSTEVCHFGLKEKNVFEEFLALFSPIFLSNELKEALKRVNTLLTGTISITGLHCEL
jgi:hypothetical protein